MIFQDIYRIRLGIDQLVAESKKRNEILQAILELLKTEPPPEVVGITVEPGTSTPRQ